MKKKRAVLILMLACCISIFTHCNSNRQQNKDQTTHPVVLVFSKTEGYYHKSIPDGIAALQKMGKEEGFSVDTTKNAAYFATDSLRKYAAVIFLNTTGDVLNQEQEKAFEEYIHSGGGFVGIHAASDTEFDWPWFNTLVGAQFASHPEIQEATILVTDTTHSSTHFLPQAWHRKDEWYNFKNIFSGINILARLDESSYSGGSNGKDHPIAWYHQLKEGRAFYTGGGHTAESFQEPLFLQHLLGGIRYAGQLESTP